MLSGSREERHGRHAHSDAYGAPRPGPRAAELRRDAGTKHSVMQNIPLFYGMCLRCVKGLTGALLLAPLHRKRRPTVLTHGRGTTDREGATSGQRSAMTRCQRPNTGSFRRRGWFGRRKA